MTTAEQRTGSRTAAYVMAALVATIPGWVVLSMLVGMSFSSAAVVVGWTCGVCWLLKTPQDDPTWDRRLPL